MRIASYRPIQAEFCPYDPQSVEAMRLVAHAIHIAEPRIVIEHIGSTSIPGCGGKGVVDLAVLYPDGFLESAKAVLDQLGFQRQGGRDVFPESRPMRVGCVEHQGKSFRLHTHVIALGSKEHLELVWLRETLRASAELRFQYEERKRAVLASGITDSIDYCNAKAEFITDLLRSRPLT